MLISNSDLRKGSDMTVRAIEIKQGEARLFLTALPPSTIDAIAAVDVYRQEQPANKRGYQRHLNSQHVSAVAAYVAREHVPDRPLFPTAVLVSSRKQLHFEPDRQVPGEGTLSLPEGGELFIVDGQHRLAGVKSAVESDGRNAQTAWNTPLPVVVMDNCSKVVEVEQFVTINDRQKRTPTDLALQLYSDLADKVPGFHSVMVETGELWKVRGVKVAQTLAYREGQPWCGRLVSPNERSKGDRFLRMTSFIQSLRPALSPPNYELLVDSLDNELDGLADCLGAYWNALADMFPEAFEKPREYVLQKTPGMFPLHRLFPLMFHRASRKGKPSRETFRMVLGPLAALEQGAYFWHRQNADGAVQYGSQRGFRLLYERLAELLGHYE
jgi:DGQHR domain-containing protein